VAKAVLAVGAEVGGFDQIPIVAELTGASAAESLSRASTERASIPRGSCRQSDGFVYLRNTHTKGIADGSP
jgi:hypothetical protein